MKAMDILARVVLSLLLIIVTILLLVLLPLFMVVAGVAMYATAIKAMWKKAFSKIVSGYGKEIMAQEEKRH